MDSNVSEATYFNVFILLATLAILPDWTVNEFVVYLVGFIDWVLVHTEKLITSFSILCLGAASFLTQQNADGFVGNKMLLAIFFGLFLGGWDTFLACFFPLVSVKLAEFS